MGSGIESKVKGDGGCITPYWYLTEYHKFPEKGKCLGEIRAVWLSEGEHRLWEKASK